MTIFVEVQLSELQELDLRLELEFMKLVLGWANIINLPSFRVTKGGWRGWAMLNRELQKCYMVKEAVVGDKYLVGIEKEKGQGIAIGEGTTLAQAATQALIAAHQGKYANKGQMKELIMALSQKQNEVRLASFKHFHLKKDNRQYA